MHSLKVAVGIVIVASTLIPAGAEAAAPRNGAPATSHGAAAPACAPGQLAVWIDTQGNGAAGSFYYRLQFTNVSTRACTLVGYPGVSAVNATGRTLGKPATRNAAHVSRRVRLTGALVAKGGPVGLGGTAVAVLQIVDVDNYQATRCGRAIAVGLRVYAPNQTVAKFVSLPILACARPGAPYLSIESVQRR